MTLTLVDLLKASGAAGIEGQSFKFNAAGHPLAAGISFNDYVLGDAVYGGTTIQPPEERTYASGHTFTGVIAEFANMGSQFDLIRRSSAFWNAFAGTADATVNSVTWNDVAKTATLSITVFGEYDPGTLPTITTFNQDFQDYPDPDLPPDNGAYTVVTTPSFGGGGAASGTDDLNIIIEYTPDSGPFNPTHQSPSFPLRISRRAYGSGSTELEWRFYENSSYTGSTVSGTFLSLDSTFTYSIWARWRQKGTVSWNNFGEIAWSDRRSDV